VAGAVEPALETVADLADDTDALFAYGSDIVALGLLEEPAAVGADVVVGEAASLGLPAADGMGTGLFACRDDFLRQVPGRLVGAAEDESSRRAFTLTLQTREQHIRKERATSNICTNQAWVALRTAMHAATLGADGLADLADSSVRRAHGLAAEIDEIDGVAAPVHDRHHFREFQVSVADAPVDASETAAGLRDHGYAVHTVGDQRLQVCVTETNEHATDGLVAALQEVTA